MLQLCGTRRSLCHIKVQESKASKVMLSSRYEQSRRLAANMLSSRRCWEATAAVTSYDIVPGPSKSQFSIWSVWSELARLFWHDYIRLYINIIFIIIFYYYFTIQNSYDYILYFFIKIILCDYIISLSLCLSDILFLSDRWVRCRLVWLTTAFHVMINDNLWVIILSFSK